MQGFENKIKRPTRAHHHVQLKDVKGELSMIEFHMNVLLFHEVKLMDEL